MSLTTTYRDLIKAATDSGCVVYMKAELVHERDTFTCTLEEKPIHTFNAFADRGQIVGVYCATKLTSGEYLTEVMTLEQINEIKNCSKNKKAWELWFSEFARKAVIKRAYKQLPVSGASSERLEQLIADDNKKYGGVEETITSEQQSHLLDLLAASGKELSKMLEYCKCEELEGISISQYEYLVKMLEAQCA